MNTNEFIAKFAEALDIDSTGLSVDTEFRTLKEWDSISYLSIIAMMDEEFDTQIENPQFKQLKTLGDIAYYIKSHK